MARKVKIADRSTGSGDGERIGEGATALAERAALTWQNRIVGSGMEAPDQLLANPFNVRIHPQRQQEAVLEVMRSVGWVQDVIVNRRTNHVVDGHLRISMAISEGVPLIPVKYVDLSEDEELLILFTYDPLASLAGYDGLKLSEVQEQVTGQIAPGSPLAQFLDEIVAKNRPPTDRTAGNGHAETAPGDRIGEGDESEGAGDTEEGGVEVVLNLTPKAYQLFSVQSEALMDHLGLPTIEDLVCRLVADAHDSLAAQQGT